MSNNPEQEQQRETAAQFLIRLGIDGDAWAKEFFKLNKCSDINTLRAWFCNAIEAGRAEGRAYARSQGEEQSLEVKAERETKDEEAFKVRAYLNWIEKFTRKNAPTRAEAFEAGFETARSQQVEEHGQLKKESSERLAMAVVLHQRVRELERQLKAIGHPCIPVADIKDIPTLCKAEEQKPKDHSIRLGQDGMAHVIKECDPRASAWISVCGKLITGKEVGVCQKCSSQEEQKPKTEPKQLVPGASEQTSDFRHKG